MTVTFFSFDSITPSSIFNQKNKTYQILHLCSIFQDKEFDPDFIRTKSGAAAGLCSWVINIIKFYEVYCDVEPKRRALEEANSQLQDAQTKLKQVKDKVLDLEATLEKLTGDYQKAIDEKMRCQEEADATNKTIQLANRYAIGS